MRDVAEQHTDLAPDGVTDLTTDTDLGDVPLEISEISDIVRYVPTQDLGGESMVFNARVPVQWGVIVDSIRQKPGGGLPPGMWPTRSDFVRWAIAVGIKHLARLQRAYEDGEVSDPTLDAMDFVERKAGYIAARAKIITDANDNLNAVAEAVRICVDLGEYEEAAGMIDDWLTEAAASQKDPFWRRYFYRIVTTNEILRPALTYLFEHEYLADGKLKVMLEERIARESDPDTASLMFVPEETSNAGNKSKTRRTRTTSSKTSDYDKE